MAAWSSALRSLGQNIIKIRTSVPQNAQISGSIRHMSGHGPRTFPMVPSRWQWNRTKDLVHFYAMLGIIPVAIIITGTNIFIGPATLQEIPEGYTPKHWEYYRSPITRFLARYIYNSPQQEYEKLLHALWEENEKVKLRQLDAKMQSLIKDRHDYQAYYYEPVTAKYHRRVRDLTKIADERLGD